MPSGKTSRTRRQTPAPRQPARVPAPPTRPGQIPTRKASPKVLAGAAVAVVAVAAAVVLAVTLGGNSSSTGSVPAVGSLTNALPGAAEVQALFRGLPQSGATLGGPKAPATMVEYVDLQCPYCAEFESQVFPKLVTRYVRTGKLRVEQRLLAFIGPDSVRGRSAAIAAGLQNKQFNFSELLYFNQGTENTGWLDERMVVAAASSVPGLRVPQVLADRSTAAVKTTAAGFDADATADRVTGTPTILVGPTGGTLHAVSMTSPTDAAPVVAAIESAIAG